MQNWAQFETPGCLPFSNIKIQLVSLRGNSRDHIKFSHEAYSFEILAGLNGVSIYLVSCKQVGPMVELLSETLQEPGTSIFAGHRKLQVQATCKSVKMHINITYQQATTS